MASSFRIDVGDEEGAVGRVFQQVGQWLERRVQSQLDEKDAAICALQKRVDALERAMRSGGVAAEGAQEEESHTGDQGAAEEEERKAEQDNKKRKKEEEQEGEEDKKRQRQRANQLVRDVRVIDPSISPYTLAIDLCRETSRGDLQEVRRLLDSGANVNFIDCLGKTPLVIAAKIHNGNVRLVSLLLQGGADVNFLDVKRESALHHAAEHDYGGRCVELLIGAGADVDATSLDGETPLHRAAQKGNEAAVRALLAAGAKRELKTWGGFYENMTPLDLAKTPTVWDLLSNGP